MGEAKVKKSATQKFIAKYPRCSLCGGDRPTTTREHMPPKSLFDGSHRPDRLVMPACHECNSGTSTADLVVSMISRWGMDLSPVAAADHTRLTARIRKQEPELIEEWTRHTSDPIARLKARAHLETHGVAVPPNAALATIGPLSIRSLNVFAHKATLALYFEHFKEPLSNEGRVQAFWRTKEDFMKDGVPSELLDIMRQYNTLIQGEWNAAETFEYRFDTNTHDGLFGFFARLRRGVFILGFAVRDGDVLRNNPDLDGDWIQPRQLLDDHPHFAKKG